MKVIWAKAVTPQQIFRPLRDLFPHHFFFLFLLWDMVENFGDFESGKIITGILIEGGNCIEINSGENGDHFEVYVLFFCIFCFSLFHKKRRCQYFKWE